MREIKFRAWLPDIQIMNNWESGVDGGAKENITDYLDDPETVLMQYTGLKDKNGKEIYEGDVVKVLHGEWMSQHLGNDEEKAMTHEQYLNSLTKQYEVVFATDCFMGKRHIGYNPWDTDDEGYTYTRLTPDKHGYVEVIGNIYENPELLTK